MAQTEQKAATQKNGALGRVPLRKSELDRFKFGKQRLHQISTLVDGSPLCLDIACGAKPFPEANVLCDLHSEPCPDRNMKKLVTEGKPFVLCSCCSLPFKDQAFDFVTSYYLIEHVASPGVLFQEIKRVSKHGYLQCPTWFNEFLYGEDVHYWIIQQHHDKLYVKSLKNGAIPPFRFGFIFHKLYKHSTWQIIHAILDEKLHLFTVKYAF